MGRARKERMEAREWGHNENGREWKVQSGDKKKEENGGARRRGIVRMGEIGSCEVGKARKERMEERGEGA